MGRKGGPNNDPNPVAKGERGSAAKERKMSTEPSRKATDVRKRAGSEEKRRPEGEERTSRPPRSPLKNTYFARVKGHEWSANQLVRAEAGKGRKGWIKREKGGKRESS